MNAAVADNDVIIKAWNTVLYEKFQRYRHLLVDSLIQHSDAALNFRGYARGERVLDIGCGFGDSTQRIARMVAPGGEAIGVDCAENFIRDATNEAHNEGVDNARFFVADVQSDDLRGPYDHAFARFGTMFFDLPGAAMRNVRSALKPGGTFTQIVWRKREENPWVFVAEQCVRAIVPVVSHEQTDQVHCGPGPFSRSARCCAARASSASPSNATIAICAWAAVSMRRSSSRWRLVPPARSSAWPARRAKS